MHYIVSKLPLLVIFLLLPLNADGREVIVKTCTPLESQFVYENTTYIINKGINLNGKYLHIPKKSVIEFRGGYLYNGNLKGDNTSFSGDLNRKLKDIGFSGTFEIREIPYNLFLTSKDDTQLLRSMFELLLCSTSHCSLSLESNKVYNVSGPKLSYGHALYEFTDVTDKVIEGNDAVINDLRPRSLVGYKNFDGVLLFSHCTNIKINHLNYQNLNEDYVTVYDDDGNIKYKEGLENQIGYVGTSFILVQNNCDSFNIKSNIVGARYGVKVGDYSQPWLSGDKGLTNSSIDITAYKTGYPVAIELGDGLHVSVKSDTHHRAAYLCGMSNATVYIEAKNIYIAPLHCLFSDTHYSKTRGSEVEYKACYNIKATINEMGSEVVTNGDSYCVGFQTYNTEPYYGRKTPLEWHDIEVVVIQTKPSDEMGLFTFSRSEPNSDYDPTRLHDVFRNISITARNPFSSKQYSGRIRTGRSAVYRNISIDVDAPKGNIIVDNLNSYQFNLSSSKIGGIFHHGKVSIPRHTTHRSIKSTLIK